jgi:hypothetical protein
MTSAEYVEKHKEASQSRCSELLLVYVQMTLRGGIFNYSCYTSTHKVPFACSTHHFVADVKNVSIDLAHLIAVRLELAILDTFMIVVGKRWALVHHIRLADHNKMRNCRTFILCLTFLACDSGLLHNSACGPFTLLFYACTCLRVIALRNAHAHLFTSQFLLFALSHTINRKSRS